jgi:hypothetical protein
MAHLARTGTSPLCVEPPSRVRPGWSFASEGVLGAIAVSVATIALLAVAKPFWVHPRRMSR